MIDELKNLLTLNDLELNIESLNVLIESVPLKIDNLKAAIDKTRKDFENLKQREIEIKKSYKFKEVDVKSIEEHLTKLNAQIFEVKTNEEYRAMLKEIDGLREKKKKIEDEMITLMEEEEENRAKIKQSAKDTETMINNYLAEIASLENHLVELNDKLSKMTAEHKDVKDALPLSTVGSYERIKKARKTGVSRVKSTICEGCFATLSPQVLNELKRGDKIIYCENCGRIIIWDGKT